mmetsp:Transcript_30849/g.31395  ORF Transcript_30849/g.31395 Transcript_30849/m.31395 type:complete len:204 (-) Transcript_30849:529-1140(-)
MGGGPRVSDRDRHRLHGSPSLPLSSHSRRRKRDRGGPGGREKRRRVRVHPVLCLCLCVLRRVRVRRRRRRRCLLHRDRQRSGSCCRVEDVWMKGFQEGRGHVLYHSAHIGVLMRHHIVHRMMSVTHHCIHTESVRMTFQLAAIHRIGFNQHSSPIEAFLKKVGLRAGETGPREGSTLDHTPLYYSPEIVLSGIYILTVCLRAY